MPPSAFVESFARLAIAPLMPALGEVGEVRLGLGAVPARVGDTAGVDRARTSAPCAMRDRVGRARVGMPKVRTKSLPVPRGSTASSTASSRPREPVRRPRCTVPSPPTTTSRRAPSAAARSVSSTEWPGCSAEERVAVEPGVPRAGGRSPASGGPSSRWPTPG